ncbi:testis-specific expressed protein 55 [Loxodonta africana]|uniref:testis-specific expressed protein 55 n=1 Tax=Loxodonta africana TaxID=9785 RepID=UPI0030D29407
MSRGVWNEESSKTLNLFNVRKASHDCGQMSDKTKLCLVPLKTVSTDIVSGRHAPHTSTAASQAGPTAAAKLSLEGSACTRKSLVFRSPKQSRQGTSSLPPCEVVLTTRPQHLATWTIQGHRKKMEEISEGVLDNSLESESTAEPTAGQSGDQKEGNWTNQAEGEAVYQSDHEIVGQAAQRVSPQADLSIYGREDQRISEQTGPRTSGQADHRASKLADTADHTASDKADQRMFDPMTSGQANNVELAHDRKMSGQADQRTSGQTDHRLSGQADRRTSEQTRHRLSTQADRRTSEQTDRRLSFQADRRTSEQTDRRLSTQADRRTSEQTDRRLSFLADRRTSEQTDRRLSFLADRRTSEQTDHRMSIQADQRTSGQTGHRLSSQADRRTSKQSDGKLSIPADQRISEQTDHRSSGLADQKAQTYHVIKPAKHEDDYSKSDLFENRVDYQADHLVDKQDYYNEDYLTDYGASGQFSYSTFTQFEDSKEDKEDDYRVQPCKFKDSQTDLSSSKVSLAVETEMKSATFLQTYNPSDSRLTNFFPAKDQTPFQRFPSIPTKLDSTLGQGKSQAIETTPDYISQFEQEKSFYEHKQTYRKRFPSMVYDDPYQVALRYMEKHNILQIFQITENLVYERPEDPLHFMLCQP